MKILLLFPPDWLPSEPYLSLPALTSVLRPAGHEVIQKDINVEMYDMFFSRPFSNRFPIGLLVSSATFLKLKINAPLMKKSRH